MNLKARPNASGVLAEAPGHGLARAGALGVAVLLIGLTAADGGRAQSGSAGALPLLFPTLPQEARPSGAPPIRVGPGRDLTLPSQAARIARDGDVVEIDAGDYRGDVAVWPQSDLTIRGVNGRAHIDAAGDSVEGKAIWVLKGARVTIDGVELSGCTVPDRNGAGIRFEGTELIVRNSWVHGNEMGLLTGVDPDRRILIESSEFSDNTVDYPVTGSLGHNIYIGAIDSFTLRGSYVHGASFGHNVKTRARHNFVLYNRIMDEDDGNSSYLIDLSEGGDAYVVGNLLQQSRATDNSAMIAYAPEGGKEDVEARVYVVNNTAVSDLDTGVFVRNFGSAPVNLINNVLVGTTVLAEGPSTAQRNSMAEDPGLRDAVHFDYRPKPAAPIVDFAIEPTSVDGLFLMPRFQYRHPAAYEPRPLVGSLDIGAYEAVAE